MKKITFFIALFFTVQLHSQMITPVKKNIYAKVLAVHDGDSYKVSFERNDSIQTKWVRLIGVDCPEVISPYVSKAQPFGKAAGDSVRTMIKGKNVCLQDYGTDAYGRLLVSVYIGETDLTEKILREGWGWYVKAPLSIEENKRLLDIFKEARANKKGLWATRAMKPSTWRRKY